MKIQVLLSAYNGSLYLKEQLDSILGQKLENCDISILIRDDNSQDDGLTIRLIKFYTESYPNIISYYKGENLGSCGSFFDLVKSADFTCDYFAFSDQDDFWLSDKLQLGINKLKNCDFSVPTVYSTQITAVDKDLQPIKNSKGKTVKKVSFGNSILENVVTGCTSIFNKSMLMELQKVKMKDIDDGLFLHDWTMYMIAMSYGNLIYNCKSSILYRQHNNNVLGSSRGMFDSYLRKLKLFIKYKKSNLIYKNISSFYNVYGDKLNQEQVRLVQLYIEKNYSIKNCLSLIFNRKLHRQSIIDTIIFKIMMIFNII